MIMFNIIISPLQRLLEICYLLFRDFTGSKGLSIVGLSFVVTLCCLPLYIVSERWQEIERTLQKSLQERRGGVKHIKETFTGDERYMMISALYRENHYHPLMALRSSFGLLIQIPFFIAAYTYLSHSPDLQGTSFLFIADLGKPDASLHIGSITLNVLPIAMTLFNGISGAVYTKGHGGREKIQIYASAIIFLLLLYQSPAGLVLYWTMNNVLSLVKNVFYKFRNPRKVLYLLTVIIAVAGIIAGLASSLKPLFKIGGIGFFVLLIAAPLLIKVIRWFCTHCFAACERVPSAQTAAFLFSAGIIAVLAGLTVPSMIMESEPHNFCYVDNYTSPFIFLVTSFTQALGLFVFWPCCFYFLFSSSVKKLLTFCAIGGATFAIVNTFLFSGDYGPMEQTIDFMENSSMLPSAKTAVINALTGLAIFVLAICTTKRQVRHVLPYSAIVLVALMGITTKNSISVAHEYKQLENPGSVSEPMPILHLSKTGKNVLVFMQDRAFMPFVQDIFTEAPGLASHFDGFVFYKNALSFAQYTMLGTPGLFGGYSYTPYEINKRDTETLQQKHNEALLSLPVTFSQNGFSATVVDMPYENYLKAPTSDMYKSYPQITHTTAIGRYSSYWYAMHDRKSVSYVATLIQHNLLMFGIFKCTPPLLRKFVYHHEWWITKNYAYRYQSTFIDNYAVMDLLPQLTDFSSESDAYIALDNEATHEPIFLQAPDYVPVAEVTDRGNSPWADSEQYHAQAGIFRCYARFFDYLKENGVYDNTRIIIVSDHGAGIETGMFDNTDSAIPFLKETIVACLLFKDFDTHSNPEQITLTEDMTFMTNADTPALALKDILPDAKNPFTGVPFAVQDKQPYLTFAHPKSESTRIYSKTKFGITDWYHVQDNIFDANNWKRLDTDAVP